MKLYTKTGDQGSTSLLSGERVKKDHIRLEAYGSTDELNSYIGLLRSHIQTTSQEPSPSAEPPNSHSPFEGISQQLYQIQHSLFNIGSHLACANQSQFKTLPSLNPQWITDLEIHMDTHEKQLPPLKEFILPGGSLASSHCQYARTLCRRVERRVNTLHEESPQDEVILVYLNRLSDYFFSLARYLNHLTKSAEVVWTKNI